MIRKDINSVKRDISVHIEKEIHDIKNYYFIIVMDLCSSSLILEELQKNGKIRVWRRFWKRIFKMMAQNPYMSLRCKPYKFVGDGFIILYRHQFSDSLFEFVQKLNTFACDLLNEILEKYNIKPKRLGFAYGIERGFIIPMHLLGKHEYVGEAINAAVRLQSLLKSTEDANSVMVSENVYKELEIPSGTKKLERNCILRNLYNDKEINCIQLWLN